MGPKAQLKKEKRQKREERNQQDAEAEAALLSSKEATEAKEVITVAAADKTTDNLRKFYQTKLLDIQREIFKANSAHKAATAAHKTNIAFLKDAESAALTELEDFNGCPEQEKTVAELMEAQS